MSEKKLENLENLELSEKELEEVAGGELSPEALSAFYKMKDMPCSIA